MNRLVNGPRAAERVREHLVRFRGIQRQIHHRLSRKRSIKASACTSRVEGDCDAAHRFFVAKDIVPRSLVNEPRDPRSLNETAIPR